MEIMNEEQPENRLEMDDELYNVCFNGALEELKNKINSTNINSRRSYPVFIFDN